MLEEQKKELDNLQKSIQNQKKQKKELEKIQQELQNKKNANWNDKKKIDQFIKRQNQYKEMMDRQTDKLQENLQEQEELTPSLQQQKESLKKRIDELKNQDRQKKLLDELQKLSEKLNKEDLVRKAKELSQQNKQQERSLERILELTKRFYVEQKTMQLSKKLDDLSKKQDEVRNQEKSLEKQQEVKKEFEDIKEELENLDKDNEKLKEPMSIPDTEDEQEDADKALYQSEESIKQNQKQSSQKKQKQASKKMKQMSQKLSKAMMDMQSQMIDANIEDMRQILKNLVTFSFKQEDLMNKFDEIDVTHPDFGKDLKKQNEIKTYFEHIDDSLYVLSMRVPMISAKIQDDIANAHYNLDESLENFSENRFDSGLSNQQYVMTSANNLADFLSNMLDNMQNSMSGKGGSGMPGGKKQQGQGLQDIIQKQKGLSEKTKKGMEKGEEGKEGKEGGGEDSDGDQFKLYQEQNLLRQELQDLIDKQGAGKNGDAKRALKEMEELENEILEKGITRSILQKMQNLDYQLLKLEQANLQQGQDKKRKSTTNNLQFEQRKIRELQLKKQFYNQIEILNRQSLPLQQNFKKKVQEYFSQEIN